MVTEELVREIVETYDLDPKTKAAVTSAATRRASETGISSYDDVYREVAELVDYFTLPREERFALRLDASVAPDSEKTLADTIGAEDEALTKMFEEERREYEYTSAELLRLLDGYIDHQHMNLLSQLLSSRRKNQNGKHNGTYWMDVSPEEIISNVPEIQRRLEVLARYKRSGKLFIPQRPVKNAWFAGGLLKIIFGRRRYDDPLEFYMKNRELYPEEMSTSDFVDFDKGLYFAMYRRGLLGRVVTEKYFHDIGSRTIKSVMTPERIKEVIEAHPITGENASKAARLKGVKSHHTVLKYWRMAGLDTSRPGRKKILNDGKEENPHNGRKFTPKQIAEIIQAHFVYGDKPVIAEQNLPYSNYAFNYFWSVVGLKKGLISNGFSEVSDNRRIQLPGTEIVLQKPLKLRQHDVARIVYAYTVYNGNAEEASSHLPYPTSVFTKLWREAGLVSTANGSYPKANGTNGEIQDYSGNGSGMKRRSFRYSREVGGIRIHPDDAREAEIFLNVVRNSRAV